MVTHHRWKCFICQKCGTGYVQWSDLKIHILKHIGEKHFDCLKYRARLLKTFSLSVLKNYIEGKPYICEESGTGFVMSGNMKQHISIHTWEWTFSCKECDSGFYFNGPVYLKERKIISGHFKVLYLQVNCIKKCIFSKCFFKPNLFLNHLLHILQAIILHDLPCAKLVFRMEIPSSVINGQSYHLEIENI